MTTLLLRQESSDRAPAFPELGLSASKEPAEKFPKKHRRWAKSDYFSKGQILLYLTSGDGLGAVLSLTPEEAAPTSGLCLSRRTKCLLCP